MNLSPDEIDVVSGGSTTSDTAYAVSIAAFTGASIAARFGQPEIAAGAAVVGLVALGVGMLTD
jgi:hypothetical protein